jgi:RNAse (barnase) inhibitor barstar
VKEPPRIRYEIDGSQFSTLEEFFREVSDVLIPGRYWGRNLDAFNDVLRGGFGTPTEGFTLRWKNHELSRQNLGYPETTRQLKLRLERCHPESRSHVLRELEMAQENKGPTVFDWLTGIIRRHCRGGVEERDGVELLLD